MALIPLNCCVSCIMLPIITLSRYFLLNISRYDWALLITSIIQGFVLNYYGRKTILKVGISALVIFHAILSTCFFIHDHNNAESLLILIIIFIFLFIISFGLSIGPISWLYNAEILPEKGLMIATFAGWFGFVVIIFVFPLLIKAVGPGPIFAGFSVCCLGSLIFIITYVKETKGLTQQQIEYEYTKDMVLEGEETLVKDANE